MKMEQTECSETSAYKIQTPGNYLKESIQHTEHGESLKLRILNYVCQFYYEGDLLSESQCPRNAQSECRILEV